MKYICTDCSIGEEKPCVFECLNPDNEKPIQCPLDEHGIGSAVWKLIDTQAKEEEA